MTTETSGATAAASARLIPPENSVTVRMYRIGHGDCFLIAFPGVAGREMQERNQWEASLRMSETVMGVADNPMRLRMEEAARINTFSEGVIWASAAVRISAEDRRVAADLNSCRSKAESIPSFWAMSVAKPSRMILLGTFWICGNRKFSALTLPSGVLTGNMPMARLIR